jgi:hypothetical protein
MTGHLRQQNFPIAAFIYRPGWKQTDYQDELTEDFFHEQTKYRDNDLHYRHRRTLVRISSGTIVRQPNGPRGISGRDADGNDREGANGDYQR